MKINLESLQSKIARKTKVRFFAYLFYASILAGCVKSPSPVADELLAVAPPYFGANPTSLTTIVSSPTINYTLIGTCDDVNGYVTEWSYDKTTWTTVACTNKQFSIPLVLNTQKTIYARSRGKFLYSDIAKAVVRLLLPPTSDVVTHVASAKSDDSDGLYNGSQNFISINWGHDLETNGTVKLDSGVPRLVYGP